MQPNSRFSAIHPIILSLVLAGGVLIGTKLGAGRLVVTDDGSVAESRKITDLLNYIRNEYVDSINVDELTDEAIINLLGTLDPHSAYIPAKDLALMNEPLEGNFEGIGVEFNIIQDTIVVVSPIAGGPSEKLGVRPGDRIVTIDGENVGGIGIKNEDVIRKLRGKKDSVVKVGFARRGITAPIVLDIVRDRIPIYSVDAHYVFDNNIGYIKVSRFSATTFEEFSKALRELKPDQLNGLVLDLRGNPGGYLNAAIEMCDELLPKGDLIVYTEGRARPKDLSHATARGMFEKGKLVVLIDEGSASASEIVAGAIQDNDRGTVIGRRSFGKGLVQEQVQLPDGAGLRLTIARYYTPAGRCIQKPYKMGQAYDDDLLTRYEHGEMYSADSIAIADTVKYYTRKGRVVHGGGGIVPDVFVPLDTAGLSGLYSRILATGLLRDFSLDVAQRQRAAITMISGGANFARSYTLPETELLTLREKAVKAGIKFTETDWQRAQPHLARYLKALVARSVWNGNGFYPVMNANDPALKAALEAMLSN